MGFGDGIKAFLQPGLAVKDTPIPDDNKIRHRQRPIAQPHAQDLPYSTEFPSRLDQKRNYSKLLSEMTSPASSELTDGVPESLDLYGAAPYDTNAMVVSASPHSEPLRTPPPQYESSGTQNLNPSAPPAIQVHHASASQSRPGLTFTQPERDFGHRREVSDSQVFQATKAENSQKNNVRRTKSLYPEQQPEKQVSSKHYPGIFEGHDHNRQLRKTRSERAPTEGTIFNTTGDHHRLGVERPAVPPKPVFAKKPFIPFSSPTHEEESETQANSDIANNNTTQPQSKMVGRSHTERYSSLDPSQTRHQYQSLLEDEQRLRVDYEMQRRSVDESRHIAEGPSRRTQIRDDEIARLHSGLHHILRKLIDQTGEPKEEAQEDEQPIAGIMRRLMLLEHQYFTLQTTNHRLGTEVHRLQKALDLQHKSHQDDVNQTKTNHEVVVHRLSQQVNQLEEQLASQCQDFNNLQLTSSQNIDEVEAQYAKEKQREKAFLENVQLKLAQETEKARLIGQEKVALEEQRKQLLEELKDSNVSFERAQKGADQLVHDLKSELKNLHKQTTDATVKHESHLQGVEAQHSEAISAIRFEYENRLAEAAEVKSKLEDKIEQQRRKEQQIVAKFQEKEVELESKSAERENWHQSELSTRKDRARTEWRDMVEQYESKLSSEKRKYEEASDDMRDELFRDFKAEKLQLEDRLAQITWELQEKYRAVQAYKDESQRLRRDVKDYKDALERRDGTTSMSDEHLSEKYLNFAELVQSLSMYPWNPTRSELPDDVLSHLTPDIDLFKQQLLQDTVWRLLYKYIFCSPFRIFDKFGNDLEQEWEQHCIRGIRA